jgi:hypothetical protein
VRTLASDLEMMGRSGGLAGQGLPAVQFERVAATVPQGPQLGSLGVPEPVHTVRPPQQDSSTMRILIWGLVILIGAGILLAAGFYLYPLFVK